MSVVLPRHGCCFTIIDLVLFYHLSIGVFLPLKNGCFGMARLLQSKSFRRHFYASRYQKNISVVVAATTKQFGLGTITSRA
jgi:hypothetical protein